MHSGSVPQIDRIAMDAGYRVAVVDEADGWVTVKLTVIDMFAGSGDVDLGTDDAGER